MEYRDAELLGTPQEANEAELTCRRALLEMKCGDGDVAEMQVVITSMVCMCIAMPIRISLCQPHIAGVARVGLPPHMY